MAKLMNVFFKKCSLAHRKKENNLNAKPLPANWLEDLAPDKK